MPVTAAPVVYRLDDDPLMVFGAVARPVGFAESRSNPAARKSLQDEWGRLRSVGDKGCWDEDGVRLKAEVVNEARSSGRKVHFG